MSEGHGEKPEVLPGDLITGPGVYESRSQCAVEVRHWDEDGWVAQWEDGEKHYFADGTRTGLYPMPDPYQLLRWIGPLPASEPEPETTTEQLAEIEGQAVPVQVREGRWRTEAGEIVSVSAMPTDHDDFSPHYPWWDGDVTTWADNGIFLNGQTAGKDLVEYLGPIEQQPQPVLQRESDAELRVKLLKHANDTQAATIGQLMTEARDLNMEIGGLQRRLSERDARIRDLETMHAAATQAVVDAGKQNDALRAQVQNRQQEYERQKVRIEFLETLNAGNGAAIDDYKAKVEKLQGLVDTARQRLEAAATECDELRAAINRADKQLDQKDAQIRDLRIELEAAQQAPQPVSDEERERIWDEATEAAGRQVIGWLTPLTGALIKQPDERFLRFMAMTLSILPDILPELLGYAVEDEPVGE